MPGPVQEFITPPAIANISIEMEPAQNLVHDLLLIARAGEISGLSEWVYQTANSLTAEEARVHRLVAYGLYYSILPRESWPSYLAYVDHLAAMDPVALRDKMLNVYVQLEHRAPDTEGPLMDLPEALASVENYLTFLRQRFGAEKVFPEIETEAYRFVIDPPAMQARIVSHMRWMWERYLAAEWERVRPILQEAVQAFRQQDYSGLTRLETARQITGQNLDDSYWQNAFLRAKRVVFIPSAHVGPYLGKIITNDFLGVVFGARLPKGSRVVAPDLSRAEILVRLGALNDDSRLRILKYIAEHGEQRSQDIIQTLGLSQSATSRHLTQLTASGFLTERRCDGSKCYALSAEQIEDTVQSLANFLLKPSAKA